MPTQDKVKPLSFFSGDPQGRVALAATAALLLLNSCANTPDHPFRPATTTPSDVKLSDAKSLDDLQTPDDVQVTLTDKLTPPQTSTAVYFGEADAFDSDDPDTPIAAMPLLAIRLGSDWKAVPLTGDGLIDAGWKYVGAGPSPREVWGVLDTSAGDSQSEFVVAHSTDGAATFSLTEFQKPCKLATVFDFAMSRSGRGHVALTLDTDCGPNKSGLYYYDTTDHGKTWSKAPRYEADAMIRADTVPDDEQPEPAQKAVQALWIHKHPQADSEESRRVELSARTTVGKHKQ